MKRELDATRGSTLPDPRPGGEAPELATFERAGERFELGAELGRGGMGRVLEATDVSLARTVAIKQVLSDRPDDLVRFEREVRITAQLEHPSIVPIYEAARDEHGRPYYVMRRIEGEPLLARLANADLRTRLALLPNLLAVVDAAAFAHARGIIHRDIKPSNILLGAYGETHLIDWGLARHLDDLDVSAPRAPTTEPLTQAGHVYGTVAYMAPEQARGEPVDVRADVYALGATLFHVLAGRAPFAHLSDVERLATVIEGEERLQPELLAEIPRELRAIIEKAMAFSPRERYAHAGELAADLRAYLAGQLVGAHHYTTGQRLRRFVRKHRFAVGLTAACLLAVGGVLGISISRIVDERDDAELARHEAETAREEASARAELLLIERASTLATTDPPRAAGLLLQLDPATRHAKRARDVISKLAAHGLARGNRAHRTMIKALELAPDGKTLATASDDGAVILHDIATAKVTPLGQVPVRPYGIIWLDASSLLVTGPQGARRIDIPTRRIRPFSPSITSSDWWRVGTRVRVLDDQRGVLSEIELSDESSRELARDVTKAVGQGELVAMIAGGRPVLLDHDKLIPLRGGPDQAPLTLAIDPSGRHVAVGWSSGEVFEWKRETAEVTRKWQIPKLFRLFYSPRQLLASTSEGVRVLFSDERTFLIATKDVPRWVGGIASGAVLAFANGDLLVVDATGTHRVINEHPRSRGIATLADRMMVAIGSDDGTVRWLDLQHVTPAPEALPKSVEICGADARTIYGRDTEHALAIERGTGTSTVVATPFVGSCGVVRGRLLARMDAWLFVVDFATQRTFRTMVTAVYVDEGRMYFIKEDGVFELPDDLEPRRVAVAPAPIRSFAVRGDWIVIATDTTLIRINRKTGEQTPIHVEPAPSMFGVTLEGALWFGRGRQLWLQTGAVPRLVSEYPEPITDAYHQDEAFHVLVEGGSLYTTIGGRTTQRVPTGSQLLFGHRGVTFGVTANDLTTYYLESGETLTREIPVGSFAAPIEPEGVVLKTRDLATIFIDPVPPDFQAARAWLRDTTNARVNPITGELYWEVPTSASPGTPRAP